MDISLLLLAMDAFVQALAKLAESKNQLKYQANLAPFTCLSCIYYGLTCLKCFTFSSSV
jgi:hypothetical protein